MSGNHPVETAQINFLKTGKFKTILWDNMVHTNICIVGAIGGGERKRQNVFEEITAKNFPNLEKETYI